MEGRKDQLSPIEQNPDPAYLEQHQATPKKRFQFIRLEDRIAPKKKVGSGTDVSVASAY